MKNVFIKLVKGIQHFVITLILLIVYFVGIGITALLAGIFNRRIFKKDYVSNDTYWVKAHDYENKMENYIRQS